MELLGFVIFLGAVVLGLALSWAITWRRARAWVTTCGPEGFWHGPMSGFNRGLRVDPERVHLHLRAAPATVAVSVMLLVLSWWLAALPLLGPMLSRLPIPRLARQVLSTFRDTRYAGFGVFIGLNGLLMLGFSRTRSEVVLEARGPLRFEHADWFRTQEWSCAPDDFVGLRVSVGGVVELLHGESDEPTVVPLFITGQVRPSLALQQDVLRASAAFAALAARRAREDGAGA